MSHTKSSQIARRAVLAGIGGVSLIALSGCATSRRISLVEAIRRLLLLAAQNAFARLTAPGGFWDSQVARIGLPDLFGSRGGVLQSILTSALFRERLQRQLNYLAEDGAERAAPLVADAVRTIGVDNALALLRGGPSAATGYLHERMGNGLVPAMVPALADAIRIGNDPVIAQALQALTGVDPGAVAQSLATSADTAIWAQIAAEEAAIRANPESTNDPLLIAALKVL